jgi:hypothetical protein
MTEDGEPVCGLTLNPCPVPGAPPVPEPVVVVDGVDAALVVVAAGGAAPAPLVAPVVVPELWAQPARATAHATTARIAAAPADRPRAGPERVIGRAPPSAVAVAAHE